MLQFQCNSSFASGPIFIALAFCHKAKKNNIYLKLGTEILSACLCLIRGLDIHHACHVEKLKRRSLKSDQPWYLIYHGIQLA